MNHTLVLNSLLVVLLYFVISVFSLDIKIPYPKSLVIVFHEPFVKIVLYMTIFLLASYNPLVSLFALIFVVLMHDNDIELLT